MQPWPEDSTKRSRLTHIGSFVSHFFVEGLSPNTNQDSLLGCLQNLFLEVLEEGLAVEQSEVLASGLRLGFRVGARNPVGVSDYMLCI